MAAVQPWSTRRAGRGLLVGVVAAAHVAAFLLISLTAPREPPSRVEPPPTFAVLPFAPPEPQARPSPAATPRSAQERRTHEKKKKPALAAAPAAPAASQAPNRAQNQALGQAPGWAPPATGAHGPAAGELDDPYAVREALRGSVGCDMENLKLRPDEQARCADRTLRWAKKGRKIGPAEDDPKRAAALAAEEDYQRRLHDWKTTNCGIGNAAGMMGTIGQLPPRRGQSASDWAAENKDAC